MIYVTRLNGKPFVINSNLIETMEETPDTVLTLTGGNKYVVAEPMEILIERIVEFQRRCHSVNQRVEEWTKNESEDKPKD